MKKKIIIKSMIVLMVILANNLFAQTKDTVRVGLFFENLYDLSFYNESFKADFWIWFNYKNDSLQFPQSIEIIKNKSVSDENAPFSGKNGDVKWTERKIKAELVKKWNIINFPFDKQKLEVEIEIIEDDTSKLFVALDSSQCGVDSNLSLNEWKIKSISFSKRVNNYKTDFGDPASRNNKFYRICFECEIERNVMSLFIKLFIGVFIAFGISIASLFISPEHVDPRFGLPVGGLFAAIGNKYIVDNIIPQTTNITLVDKIHFLTFFMIFITITTSIWSQKLFYNQKINASRKLDLRSFWVLLVLYVLAVILWIL